MCEHRNENFVQRTFGAAVGLPETLESLPGIDYGNNDDGGECTHCGEDVATGEGNENGNSELYCTDCYYDRYAACEECACELDREAGDDHYFEGRRGYRRGYRRNGEETGPFCQSCFADKFTRCRACNEYVGNDDAIRVDGYEYCEVCYDEQFTCCGGCGESVAIDDATYDEGHDTYYCTSCYDNSGGEGDFVAKLFCPHHNSTHRTGSDRKFGVELETSSCADYMNLKGLVHFGAKDDGSITGKEFVSTILNGDAGLAAIEDFCAKAREKGFQTNSSCGYHVHCDVRDLSTDQLKSVATAYFLTREVWGSFVSSHRRGNHYCGRTPWNPDSLDTVSDFQRWADSQDRYAWFNVASLMRHGTFEIRLHSATLDAVKVTNWVVAHIRFIAAVAKMTASEVKAVFQFATKEGKFRTISRMWGVPALADFYSARADEFESPVRVNFAHAS